MNLAIRFVLILLCLFSTAANAQHSRTGISGFYIPERRNLAIGFTAFDVQDRLFSHDKFVVDYGLRFIGATTGRRGGYFAFGYFSDLALRPSKIFQPGLNLAFLAGGGAAAPDR